MNISLPLEMEQQLRECAAATGLAPEHFVLQAVEEKMADMNLSQHPQDQEWFLKELQEIINLHPDHSIRVDDSRESIYADRGI